MSTPATARVFPTADPSAPLDEIHHIAISVRDVAEAVDWYRKHFRCEIGYQDAT
ncbi:MAG: VOC family protein [Planctomycetota bacterium]